MMGVNASYPDRQGTGIPTGLSIRTSGTPGRVPGTQLFLTNDNEAARDKKKKSSKFATLRRKLIRARRHSRSYDHARAIREFTSSWNIWELQGLVEEYEATAALKELAIHAALARTHANSFKEDLSALYDCKYCTDVDLIYRGACFPAHRAILLVRCAFFRNLLARYPQYGAQIPVNIRTPGVDLPMFSALLRYLYTGEFHAEDSSLANYDVLVQLGEEFGIPNPLEHDLRTLLETGQYSDTVLVFATDMDHHMDSHTHCPDNMTDSRIKNSELRCHKAILAARSPFFRKLLQERVRPGEEMTCMVLDDSVIPKQYARVLLNTVYLDTVDLSLIVHNSASMCSLSEVQAMVAGKGHTTQVDEAMEIYQIGQFLDFPMLSQGCEDVLVEQLSIDNLVTVLNWSGEAHGSGWVHRQALHYLQEEFLQVAHSPVIHDLTKDYLVHALKSDFLQAGELDVLSTVIKWGEQQLIKRMEEREPNLLSHTTHSVSKKGIRKRDLNDTELRDILIDLTPHIRTDHVLPPNSDVLNSAIKRGLLSSPPSHMMGDEGATRTSTAWVRGKNNGMFVKPRLFTPYYEECKALLEEQIAQVKENEVVRLPRVQMSGAIPDTLYMVGERHCGSPPCTPFLPSATSTVDHSGTVLVPDTETLKSMKRREHQLQHSKCAQRSYSLACSDRRAISHYLQLRVVREYGLPDSTADVLSSASLYYQEDSPERENRVPMYRHYHTSQPIGHYQQHSQCHPASYRHTHQPAYNRSPATPRTPSRHFCSVQKERNIHTEGILSEMIPDIAMASSSLGHLSLQDVNMGSRTGRNLARETVGGVGTSSMADLELDLGDGAHHGTGTGTLYI